MMSKKVLIFRGEYFFLSNQYLSEIKWNEKIIKSAEHFYQASKCLRKNDREKILSAPTAKVARLIGRFVEVRPHWNVDRVQLMEYILKIKFCKGELKKLLRKTGDMLLINQNFNHEMFWGVCGCTKHQRGGMNMLGKILMKIRDGLNKQNENIFYNE